MGTTTAMPFQSDERSSSLLSATALVGPATAFVTAGLLAPLAILLRYSFNRFDPRRMMVETFSLDNYVKFFADPYYTGVLWTTLRVAALCTLACLIMGLPLAYVLARTQSRFKNVMIMLVVLPLFVGNAVRAAGWMTLFGSKGFLNVSLIKFGVITEPLQLMFTEGAVVAGIIGTKKFAYDLWGDTVNTASRLASSAAAGEMLLSETVYAMVAERFPNLEKRSLMLRGKEASTDARVLGAA